MSITAKLEVFTLKIREKGNRDNYLNLNDIAGFKLIDEISNYLGKNIYLFKIDSEAEKTSRIEKNELEGNSLYCRIKVGKFGESSELVDTLSGSGIFHKEREHSDTIPLFFHMKVVDSGEYAIFNIESCNSRSIIPEIKNIIGTVLESLRENLFIYELKPLKQLLSIKDFIKKDLGVIQNINLSLDFNLNSEFLESPIVTIKAKPRKQFPEEIVSLLLNYTEGKNLEILNKLLPKKMQNISISGCSLGLKMKNRSSIRVNIDGMINLTNNYTIETPKESVDKFGHPSYKYLKNFSDSI